MSTLWESGERALSFNELRFQKIKEDCDHFLKNKGGTLKTISSRYFSILSPPFLTQNFNFCSRFFFEIRHFVISSNSLDSDSGAERLFAIFPTVGFSSKQPENRPLSPVKR